jgi:hypothetical protein
MATPERFSIPPLCGRRVLSRVVEGVSARERMRIVPDRLRIIEPFSQKDSSP